MEFVSFELAKKLKEKGFEIPTRSIVAMYNEQGVFFTLTTAADYQVSPSGYRYRCYYAYDDFDEHDYIAPTISQVLKWLREKHATHIETALCRNGWYFEIVQYEFYEEEHEYDCKLIGNYGIYDSYEKATLAGIEYVLDNLI